MAKASESGSLVTLRPANSGRGRDSGWESDQDAGMAAALAASLQETEPMVRTEMCVSSAATTHSTNKGCCSCQHSSLSASPSTSSDGYTLVFPVKPQRGA